MAERRGTKALELWCRRMVEGYPGVKIDNMTTSWRDGLAFCAIIHHFRPELIDFSKLIKGDIYHNNDLAFSTAEKHLGIPALLEPEDMVEYEVPDRLSILTYLAQFYRAFSTPQGSSPSRIVPKRPAPASERGIVSPASTSPPTKMINRSGGIQRRDPCSKCGLPVFIAERLNVGKELFHRTCFRCARCNSQLSLANYYVTDSNQFCCETCPDEETNKEPPATQVQQFLRGKSLSDEEKSASLEKKYTLDSYSSMFESVLENIDDASLKKDSILTSQLTSARSHFLTTQVEVSQSSASENETDMELPELPKTKPPDLKVSAEERREDNEKNNYTLTKNNSVNQKSKINDKDSDLKSVAFRTKNSDQLQAATYSDSYRVNNSVVTKDNLNSSDEVSNRPTSVRDRLKLFETRPSESDKPKWEKKTPQISDKPDYPISKGNLQAQAIKKVPDFISTSSPIYKSSDMSSPVGRLSLSPVVPYPPDRPQVKEPAPANDRKVAETTDGIGVSKNAREISQLNTLLETQILKKSRTSPSLSDLITPKAVSAESTKLTHQSFEDLSIAHQRKLIEEKKDVSALDAKLVDLGVIDFAPKVFTVETHSPTIDHPVSEQLVEKDDSQVLGDGDLKQKCKEEVGAESIRSDDAIEVISSSNSVIETNEDISTDNSRKHVSQSGDEVVVIEDSSVIEISDETEGTVETSNDKTEDYPEDLNPFGNDQEKESSPVVQKSLNPFDDDDDGLQFSSEVKEEQVPQKPIPTTRRNFLPKEEKKEKSLNPFDEDTDEDQEEVEIAKTPKRKRIPAPPLQTEDDTPDMLYIKRISISNNDNYQKKPVQRKILAAPRISLNPVWSDVDDDDGEEGGNKTRGPVPTPRKSRSSIDQHTPEPKLKDQHAPSVFGSNSSLSSANSGSQSVRKKKPAPRPPILSPDRQESTQSSLTSSPSTSAQHSPRLSGLKNRKTKRAPPPPSCTPKNLSLTFDTKDTSTELSFIEQQNQVREEWDKEKDIKDEENRNRQTLILPSPDDDESHISRISESGYVPNKSTYGKWKKKKGPAPSRPIPQKRTIKHLPFPELKKELDLIELQQQGLEKQGVRLEQIIRERCEGPEVDPDDVEPIDVEDLILQLFEVVNEKNELCRRQAELMYLKKQQRLEEEHLEIEYQIRCLMMQPEANKTDTDKAREDELIARLVEIVEKRNEIIECLEIDRLRENDEDICISNSLNTYAAKREELVPPASDEESDKKDKKKKKKIKLKFSKKTDLDKDIDESESGSQSSNKEKKKKKFALF